MYLKGKGKELDTAIRNLITKEISIKDFKAKFGKELFVVVADNFLYDAYLAFRAKDKEAMKSVANRISMFCAAFV